MIFPSILDQRFSFQNSMHQKKILGNEFHFLIGDIAWQQVLSLRQATNTISSTYLTEDRAWLEKPVMTLFAHVEECQAPCIYDQCLKLRTQLPTPYKMYGLVT